MKKNIIKNSAIVIAFFTIVNVLFCSPIALAQDSMVIYRFDERDLSITEGSSIVGDATAFRGTAIFRPLRAPSATFWFGPYKQLQGGNYLVQFRLKVGSNLSDAFLCSLDVFSASGNRYNSLNITPSMFRNSNEWQLFTIPIEIPDNPSDFELRGISFTGGVADMYLDYITITPGDARGFYSNEFTISGKGNVGIGTRDQQGYKLAVKGNIHAQEVKVDMDGWADYVFKSDYELFPLSDLKAYIDKNQHLPEMPSEKEIVDKGLSLGEMNKLLTKKVEELTLYLIEKDKQMKIQDDRLLGIEKKLKVLSKN